MNKTLLLLLSLFSSSCVYQQQVSVDWNDPERVAALQSKLPTTSVYLHDKGAAYKAENVQLSDTGLQATIVWKVSPADLEELRQPKTRKQQKQHKNDVNIYLNKELETISASSEGNQPILLQKKIDKATIERIQTYQVDTKKSFSNTLLIIVFIFFAVLLFLYLLFSLLAYASADASGQSDSGSGQSNSGSNSDSGDSGSDGSGGSDSGSGSGSRPVVPPILGSILFPNAQ